ncbi:hypothetical protein OBBRIDRAFT_830229 [Obba rivulosa]|uniref:GATA-type domain-containing protein n=1 Tax=Obba rivulosa TaxID=1052685 RepID=A0A8E2DV09_9APHY|nr:hypothetical protein OBBRIDRAFT_830229 [Obba rivulosa]
MAAYVPPYEHPHHAHPPPNSQAHPSLHSAVPATSYSSLGQALTPTDARGSHEPVYRPTTDHTQPSHPQMASDGRYVYHSPQEVAPAYGYPPYAAPAYDHNQFAQGGSRPQVRPSQPPPRSSQDSQQTLNTPSTNYTPTSPQAPQPQYAPPTYGVPPSAPWTGEAQWAQYPPSFAPPHPGQEPPQSAPVSHTDAPSTSSTDSRAYPIASTRPEQRRTDERPAQPPDPSKARKTKESDAPAPAPPQPPPPPVQPAISLGLDFVKLADSYRFILDAANAVLQEPELARQFVAPDSAERMAQAAAYGAHAVDAANKRAIELSRPPADRPPDGGDEATAKARQAAQPQADGQPAVEGQTCLGCNATSTPEWRRGPMGPRTLCNACGLVYAKLIKKRNRDLTRSRGAAQAKQGAQGAHLDESAQPSSGEGGSDDDSYGSQDRRSDSGFQGGRE